MASGILSEIFALVLQLFNFINKYVISFWQDRLSNMSLLNTSKYPLLNTSKYPETNSFN